MINIKTLTDVKFGEDVVLNNLMQNYLATSIQNYFGKDNTGFIPKKHLDKLIKEFEDLETKYGREHIVVINEDKSIISELNNSLYTNPLNVFKMQTPLRISKETKIYKKLNTVLNKEQPVEFANSYVLSPINENFSFGLTIATREEIKKYAPFNKTIPK